MEISVPAPTASIRTTRDCEKPDLGLTPVTGSTDLTKIDRFVVLEDKKN